MTSPDKNTIARKREPILSLTMYARDLVKFNSGDQSLMNNMNKNTLIK